MAGPMLRRAIALIVYLIEAKGPVGRNAAAALLWPDADKETALARLRRMLNRMPAALGQQIVKADRTSLRLSPSIDAVIDSQTFEAACNRGDFEQAIQAYRGDFLDGFVLDCPEFDEWAFFRREALRGRLINALERLVLSKSAAGEHSAAAEFAARLVSLDPLSEVYSRHLIRSHLLAGDRVEAGRYYAALVQRLRDELGVEPEPETQALIAAGGAIAVRAATRYAYGDGVHIAYQIRGAGEFDIIVMPGFVSSVERVWDLPAVRSFAASIMTMGRLIVFDPRGIGLSDRGMPPSPDGTVEDIKTVLQAAKSKRVVLLGASQSGASCIRFAVENPSRVAGLILIGAMAKACRAPDYPFALSAEQFDTWHRRLLAEWGAPAGIETFGPSLSGDPQAREWWAGLLRAAASPGSLKSVLEALRDVDVRPLLPQVSVPTLVAHRRHDRAVPIEAGRYIAERIPRAQFLELEGCDHWFFAGEQEPLLATIRGFLSELAAPRNPRARRPVVHS